MDIAKVYRYSWFSSLAYVEWDDTKLTLHHAAQAAENYPNTPPYSLGEKFL